MTPHSIVRALPGLLLVVVLALAGPARAQHGAHSTPAAPPPASGDRPGHQMDHATAESGPAMLWQMYMDIGIQAYRHGLQDLHRQLDTRDPSRRAT